MKSTAPAEGRVRAAELKLASLFDKHIATYTRYALAFVFFWFGAQKPLVVGSSPVDTTVAKFFEAVVIEGLLPIKMANISLVVGGYEVLLGTLFLLAPYYTLADRGSTLLFIVHQLIAFLPLFIVPAVAFQPEQYVTLGSMTMYWQLDWFSAFILKNVLFVAAFGFYYRETHLS